MAFGDLSQFLPSAEGDKLNVAQAQTEATKRASYLSSMDQFYEGLEETQRQFDIQQALSERQFEWMSGFEESKLEAETTLAEDRLAQEKELTLGSHAIERERIAAESRYREGMLSLEGDKLELAEDEQEYMQWFKRQELDLSWGRLDLEATALDYEYGKDQGPQLVSSNIPWKAPVVDPYWKPNRGRTGGTPKYGSYGGRDSYSNYTSGADISRF